MQLFNLWLNDDAVTNYIHEFVSCLLSEMELMCDRVGVIQQGNLISIQSVEDLIHTSGTSRVWFTVNPAPAEQAKRFIPNSAKGRQNSFFL